MIILATSDVHSPEYLSLFMEALRKTEITPDIVVFAGDMVEKNKVFMLKPVVEATMKKFPGVRIIAVFGNDEYRGYEKLYVSIYKEITWLNDDYLIIGDRDLCIVGTRGALDKPTSWQAKNIPGIQKYYAELPYRIEQIASQLRSQGCKKIVLISHYGVTRKNLEGEKEDSYPYLASTKLERVIRREILDCVIHGHVHLGVNEVVYVRDVPVYNVSLPGRKKLVEIKI
jgi:Calcineurin-like phosphoesterase.